MRLVLTGMEYLHAKKVAHRDFKSLNVLMSTTRDGQPVAKIADFGISKDSSPGNTKVQTKTLVNPLGTPAWSAPEVLRHTPNLDPYSADVWSFGVVVWEVVTREVPWAGCDLFAIMNEIGNNGLSPTMPDNAPAELASLYKSCCVLNPGQR